MLKEELEIYSEPRLINSSLNERFVKEPTSIPRQREKTLEKGSVKSLSFGVTDADDIFDDIWNVLKNKKPSHSALAPKKVRKIKQVKKTKQVKKRKQQKKTKKTKEVKIKKVKQPQSTIVSTRERKVCPKCKSLGIHKLRHHHGSFECKVCSAVFQVPAVRQVKIHKSIPEMAQKEVFEIAT